MGAWGSAVSSNDTYADVRGDFFDFYNDGESVNEITSKLVSAYADTIDDPDDCHNFWFALAKAQWECKELDPELLDRVTNIIDSGADLAVWRRLDADEGTLRKRKEALEKFLQELRSERLKAKARKRKVIRQPPFNKGDCLTFKLDSGNFGGAVVLEALRDTEFGYSLIATTRINQPNKPTKAEFENAEVLIMNYANWTDTPCLHWYLPVRHKNVFQLIETVDRIDVQLEYDTANSEFGFVADFDHWVINAANQQFESEESKPRPTAKQTIKALTKRSRWRFR